jgi:MFS family permease
MKLPGRLAALRERNFRLFFIGQATSQLGTGMVPVALSWAVLELTGSVSDLGLVLAAQTVPLVLFLLVGGTVADRLPRRAVMLVSDSARSVTQGLLAALLITGHAELWELLVLQFLGGTATAFFLPAVTGLTTQAVPAERLQEANASVRWPARAAVSPARRLPACSSLPSAPAGRSPVMRPASPSVRSSSECSCCRHTTRSRRARCSGI